MEPRTLVTAVGAGVTTFLFVAVAVIESLGTELSAIVGLPVGLVAGLAVLIGVWTRLEGVSPALERAVSAYGAFGLTVLALFGLRYVNVGRGVLPVEVIAGVGAAAVVAVYVGLSVVDRRAGS